MRRRDLCLDVFTEQEAVLAQDQQALHGGADPERRRMLQALSRAAQGELTGRQFQCVELYYFQGFTLQQTGAALEIDQSTVSRHLKKARQRLKAVLSYSFPQLTR